MSESENRLDSELAAIEAALGSLAPASSNIRRDRLMFLAGSASVDARPAAQTSRSRGAAVWLWPCATTASLLVAATFAALWATHLPSFASVGRDEVVAKRDEGSKDLTISIASSPQPSLFPKDEGTTSSPLFLGNRQLCQLVLEKGIDALPKQEVFPHRGKPAVPRQDGYRDLLRQLLDGSAI
jgi:hypothetical protein